MVMKGEKATRTHRNPWDAQPTYERQPWRSRVPPSTPGHCGAHQRTYSGILSTFETLAFLAFLESLSPQPIGGFMTSNVTTNQAQFWSNGRIKRLVTSEVRAEAFIAAEPDLQKEFGNPQTLFAYAKALRAGSVFTSSGMAPQGTGNGDMEVSLQESSGLHTLDEPKPFPTIA